MPHEGGLIYLQSRLPGQTLCSGGKAGDTNSNGKGLAEPAAGAPRVSLPSERLFNQGLSKVPEPWSI